MAVTTTGSLTQGAVWGLGRDALSPSLEVLRIEALQSPDKILTSPVGSEVCFNGTQYYMGTVTGGSTWVKLGSVA